MSSSDQNNALDTQAVEHFRQYLQIPSVHPNINYDSCVKFLENQAKSLDLPVKTYYMVPKKPIVVLTWVGSEPNLPSILLNSHMDVVPVFEDKWTHKPFSAHLDEQNNIYARGTQDMKCVGIQYLEAIRRLKQQGVALKRTLHISFAPDEEIGGGDGWKKFVHSKEFQDLKVGATLDEGITCESDEFVVFYAERCPWQFHIHCPGKPGHGSLLMEGTAGEKVSYILAKLYEFRTGEKQKLEDNPTWTIGNVTALNLTQIKGGVQTNVVPPEFVLTIDCRIPPSIDLEKFEATLNQWCKEAGSDVWIEFIDKASHVRPTKLDDSNPYWLAFKKATDKLGLKLKPQISPAVSDTSHIRRVGLPGIGFSPINHTSVALHKHDEYLPVQVFLKGIVIYCEILKSLGNIEDTSETVQN